MEYVTAMMRTLFVLNKAMVHLLQWGLGEIKLPQLLKKVPEFCAGMIMIFGIKWPKMEVVPGMRLPHRCWHEEKLPWLLKTSTIQMNCCY